MKSVLIPILTLVIGVLFGWYGTTFFLTKFMLSNAYMAESATVQKNILVLEKLNQGKFEEAQSVIRLNLNSSRLFLDQCSNDLCKEKELPHIKQALISISEHTQ